MRRSTRTPRPSWILLAAALVGLAPAACSLRSARLPELPAGAARALAEARTVQRAAGTDWLERARSSALAAADIAPAWVAPRRFLDELERERLRGPAALAERRDELERSDGDAALLYLVGRLEGRAGVARLERAVQLEPSLSWAHHGVAWTRFQQGDLRGAIRAGRAALDLARGSFELCTFATALAQYELAGDEPEEAVGILGEISAHPALEEPERTECRAWLARAELACEPDELVERGFWRAVSLLEEGTLTPRECAELAGELLESLPRIPHPEALAVLESALTVRPSPGIDLVRARVLLERGAGLLAGALLELEPETPVASSPLTRSLGLERGDARGTIEDWLAALPARVLDAEGLPRDQALRALVEASRGADEPRGALAFGDALLAAGWFAEAQGWAQALARTEPAAALELDARAAAGRGLLGGIHALLSRVDSGREALAPSSPAPAPARGADRSASREPRARRIESLDELLAAMQPLFERFHGGGAEDLPRSPRLSFGSFATLVHPGPTFSNVDQEAGLGEEGTAVPGLARELAALGRFGIFGEATGGGGPDGTVLRRLGSEWRAGELLGVPFRGLVVWCEGTDVPSRPGRQGSPVSGAALHEGYWIDLEGVRREHERALGLERGFLDADPAALELALAGRGPRLSGGSSGSGDERVRWLAPLGEGERVLLALLQERARAGRASGERLTLDEVLDLTELHEQGHLTDRTRFLPLSRHWGKALGFVLRHGFSPRSIARALEYRAQLVALCEAAEPRLALAECLSAADEQGGVLPHGEAYRELVQDLLASAAEDLARFPALDPGHYLLYQMHFLSGEEVRALALEVARGQGMVED